MVFYSISKIVFTVLSVLAVFTVLTVFTVLKFRFKVHVAFDFISAP